MSPTKPDTADSRPRAGLPSVEVESSSIGSLKRPLAQVAFQGPEAVPNVTSQGSSLSLSPRGGAQSSEVRMELDM